MTTIKKTNSVTKGSNLTIITEKWKNKPNYNLSNDLADYLTSQFSDPEKKFVSTTHLGQLVNVIIIDPKKAGYDITAFLGIYLEKGSLYKDAVDQLTKIKEVVELHYTTGSYSMFAKITCRDTDHLRHVLNEEIQAVKGIQRTETLISLEESIKRQIELTS